jgi:hypothetical protein
LRNKAPSESYLTGVTLESLALDTLDRWLSRGPDAKLLGQALAELSHHAAETPPLVDTVLVEAYRAGGNLENPSSWTYAMGPAGGGRVREPWLVRGITLSFDTPWETARKARLWRLGWSGIVRWAEAPYWDVPRSPEAVGRKEATRRIMQHWLAAKDGSSPARERVASLLDNSWLADERLFPDISMLRGPATRGRARVEATRLCIALQLHERAEKRAAASLADVTPKYLKELPVDPYSGKDFGYRVSKGEDVPGIGRVPAGQSLVWSVGPDGSDHGGTSHGGALLDLERWERGGLDWIRVVERGR